MKAIKLEKWAVTGTSDNPYLAPELRQPVLCGYCDHHPVLGKGGFIHTSVIKSSEGLTVKTRNSTYILGEIDPKYLKWMEENNLEYDSENPIKIK